MEPDPDQIICSLFQEWAESLFRYAFRLTRSPETADDLVQEAFLSLYLELRRGREMTNPRAWMIGLISHKAAKVYRDLRRWAADQSAMDSLAAPDNRPEPRWDVGGDELTPLLKLLSAREAEVVLLRLQSLKYREIADQLSISHKSVATLLARALAKMQHGAARPKASREDLVDWRHDDASLQ
jgi:RNA polymerase sigma-70 factor (ECF subfamily)